LALTAFVLNACKEPTFFDFDTTLPEDQFNLLRSDTLTLVTRTTREDSISSDEFSRDLLGIINDPVFGISTSSIATRPLLPGRDMVFPDNAVLKSITLSMVRTGYYGDENSQQTFEIYQLDEQIYFDSIYYSNRNFNINSKIGEWTGSPKDSVIHIDLTPAFGNKILTADSSNFVNDTTFANFLKGLIIKPANVTGVGAIHYFQLVNNNSRLTITYNDSLSVVFPITNRSPRINLYSHDYTGTPVMD
jgi:hypothetical protein